jgi:PAS domain-containing protein
MTRARNVTAVTNVGSGPKSLPLILARELAANLSTAMFLLDATGTLVFYNDAAEIIIGKPFAELGEISAADFGELLRLADPDGTPLRRRDSPAGVAFLEHRPSHRVLAVTGFDTTRRLVEATAYPLLGAADEMLGVVNVFWQLTALEDTA